MDYEITKSNSFYKVWSRREESESGLDYDCTKLLTDFDGRGWGLFGRFYGSDSNGGSLERAISYCARHKDVQGEVGIVCEEFHKLLVEAQEELNQREA